MASAVPSHVERVDAERPGPSSSWAPCSRTGPSRRRAGSPAEPPSPQVHAVYERVHQQHVVLLVPGHASGKLSSTRRSMGCQPASRTRSFTSRAARWMPQVLGVVRDVRPGRVEERQQPDAAAPLRVLRRGTRAKAWKPRTTFFEGSVRSTRRISARAARRSAGAPRPPARQPRGQRLELVPESTEIGYSRTACGAAAHVTESVHGRRRRRAGVLAGRKERAHVAGVWKPTCRSPAGPRSDPPRASAVVQRQSSGPGPGHVREVQEGRAAAVPPHLLGHAVEVVVVHEDRRRSRRTPPAMAAANCALTFSYASPGEVRGPRDLGRVAVVPEVVLDEPQERVGEGVVVAVVVDGVDSSSCSRNALPAASRSSTGRSTRTRRPGPRPRSPPRSR